MSMTENKRKLRDNSYILKTLDELVPQNHLVRKLDKVIDWTFIYPIVKDLYSEKGRASIDPVILFKMVFINYTFGINSMRKTCQEIEVNMAYRWFLTLSVRDKVPNYSTFSKNYERRFKDTNVFEEIFNHILKQAIKAELVDLKTIYGDATHVKANANKNKSLRKEVEIQTKIYQEQLDKEIDEERKEKGKKQLNRTEDTKETKKKR